MKKQKTNVLLIEGNLLEGDFIREMLAKSEKLTFFVQHVGCLADGLGRLQKEEFDVVLVDLGLPDSQGLDTALSVVKQAGQTPVVALTALDDEEAALKSLEMGIQDYLIKDEINSNLLSRAIRYAIQRKRDVESLRESEQRFASFMYHLPAAAWMKDLHGRYVYANAEAERVFSTLLPSVQGKTDEEVFPQETARRFRENDERVLAEGGHLRTIEVLRHADGIEHQSIVSKFAMPDPDGQPAYVAGVAFDITESKRLEAEIQRIASFPLLNPNPILELDTNGTMTFCNPATQQILEKAGCDDSANPFIPQDIPLLLQDLREKRAGHFHREMEIDGSFFEELIYIAPPFQSLRIYTMEITERKRVEAALRESEAKFSKAFQAVPALLSISSVAEGRYIDVNEEFIRTLEYERYEVIGHTSLELGIWNPPSDRELLISILRENGKVRDFETRLRSKRGHIIIGLVSSEMIEIGGEECLLTITRDISGLRKAEEEQRRLALIVESSEDAIIGKTLEGTITSWNKGAEKIYGFSAEEVKGKHISILAPPDLQNEITQVLEKMKEGEIIEHLETTRVTKDGRNITVSLTISPILAENNRIVGASTIARDITDRKRAEEEIVRLNTDLAARAAELEAANREVEAFNYTVAHDLRKPLTTINGYCQIIRDMCGNNVDKECRGYLDETYESTLRMSRLIETLLNYSRLAHAELRRQKVDLSAMALKLAAELKSAEPGRRVTFKIADGVCAEGDPNLLQVVLDNLLGNAWKYTGARDEGFIEFGETKVNGKPAWFVRDNGAGFDMAHAEKMFQPFQRLPGTEEFRGTGIGLATVEGIIRRHGGEIWAEGEPDKGATLYFTLGQGPPETAPAPPFAMPPVDDAIDRH